MRVITDLKALREWQLNKQENGNSRALLILSKHAAKTEHIQLLCAAKARCDLTLAVADVSAKDHSETLRLLADHGCSAVLLWDEKTLYPNGQCVRVQLEENCPTPVHTEALRYFAGQFLHLRCLAEPTLTIINQHQLAKLWLAQRLSAEYFHHEEIVAINVKPESEGSRFLLTVLERCVLAIRSGKNAKEILQRGQLILQKHKQHIVLFGCFDSDTLSLALPENGKQRILWAQTHFMGEHCEAALPL